MIEYMVLGGVLIIMGAVQVWLRWGPWGKEIKGQQQARAGAGSTTGEAAKRGEQSGPVVVDRGAKLWNKWTGILGPLGIAFGVLLIIWGAVVD
jgi:hypothetical protein